MRVAQAEALMTTFVTNRYGKYIINNSLFILGLFLLVQGDNRYFFN
tara:strand:+ start:15303 stop:15440 length:138 start_codon:yes stop_codon:yes gene_type:complete